MSGKIILQSKLDSLTAHNMTLGMQFISNSTEWRNYVSTINRDAKLTVHGEPDGLVIYAMRQKHTREIAKIFMDPESVIRFAAEQLEYGKWML